MASYTIYANTDDQVVSCASATYSNAREGTGTLSAQSNANATGGAAQRLLSGTYTCFQLFMHFDTSGVTGSITDVSLTIGVSTTDSGSNNVVEVRELNWSGTGTGKFVAGSALSSLAEFNNGVAGNSSPITFPKTVASVGIAANYGIVLYGQGQRTNTTPTVSGTPVLRTADQTGTTNDPYLSITTVTSVSLTVNNASHAHTATSPTLAAKSTLAANGATHAHASTSPTLTFIPGVAPDNATHSHAATSPALDGSVPVAIDDCDHVHDATSPDLTPLAILAVNDNEHAHEATSPALIFFPFAVIGDSYHGHTATSPELSRVTGLVRIEVGGSSPGRTSGSRSYASSSTRSYRAGGGRAYSSTRSR